VISFTVYGHPEPQGSTKAFIPKGWTRPIITSDNKKLKPWRQEISRAALDAMAKEREGLAEPFAREVPVCVRLDFFLARPASLPKRCTWPVKKPDSDKLCRGVLDALTGVVFVDDSQVVQLIAAKWYGQPERVTISVATAKGAEAELRESTRDLFATLEPANRT
jgi:Holliday junction resolvase RusA-like endonuclease